MAFLNKPSNGSEIMGDEIYECKKVEWCEPSMSTLRSLSSRASFTVRIL